MTPPHRPLRIVFVAPFGLRQKTTVWARTLPIARGLNALGHTASILVPPWDSTDDSGALVIRDGVRIEHVSLGGGIPGVASRMLRRIQATDPDIVHIVKPRAYAGIVQWILWQLRRSGMDRPALVLDIDDWEKPWAAINRYPPHQATFLAWQEEWGIRHADGITAASGWLYDRAGSMAPATPRLYLPNGVDVVRTDSAGGAVRPVDAEYYVNNLERDYVLCTPPRVLLLSRFVEVQPTWLGKMWRTLQQRVPDVFMFVAGRALHPSGEKAYLRALAKTQADGQRANVVWLGYVQPGELTGLYDSVDCAIYPSADTEILRAKCSVRMATALRHGVPVVASAVGEQAAYGDEGAAFLTPADAPPAQFADSVATVLSDEEIRAGIGRAAAQRMNTRYSWPSLAQSLDEFYTTVV